MRHHFLDRFSRIDSPVHRLPAGLKLGIALLIILTAVIVPFGGWIVPCLLVLSMLLTVPLTRIPAAFLLRRMLFLEPFILGIALLSLLSPGGVRLFLWIVLKSSTCLFAALLLANTTPFSEILRVLAQLRVPRILITILALMYRYLYVLLDEVERMGRARRSRTFVVRRRHAWEQLAGVIGQTFVRSTERAERIYAAMRARGWS